MDNDYNRMPKMVDYIIDTFFVMYLVTCCIEVNEYNAILQNIAYISFIGLSLCASRFRICFNKYVGIYGLYLAFSLISVFWSINTTNTLSLMRMLFKSYVIIVAAVSYYTPSMIDEDKRILKFIHVSLCITNCFVIATTSMDAWLSESAGRAVGISTVRAALHLSMSSCCFLYFWLQDKRKIYNVVLAILFFGASLFTAKRTGLVFLLVFIFAYSFFSQRELWSKFVSIVRVIIIIAVGVYIVLNIPALYETIGERVISFVQTFIGGQETDASTIERTQILEYSFELLRRSPIIGNGLNATRSYLGDIGFQHVTYAHNDYLEILTGTGLIGFLLYESNFARSITNGYRLLKQEINMDVLFAFSFLLSFMVCNMLCVTCDNYYDLIMVALLCSYIDFVSRKQLMGGDFN